MTDETAPIATDAGAALTAEELQATYEAWWAERKAQGLALQRNSRRVWSAMEGWGAVKTQEDWERVQMEAAEDWASGRALLEMLGAERYLAPERAALLLHLWRHFLVAYDVDGPAELLTVAMALVAFNQLTRVNELVGNLENRLEDEFFATEGLREQHERRYGRGARTGALAVEETVRRLGQDLLPLLDRCNRMVIRNLKLLRELKTAPLALTVENYGQMNVGQVQTNVAKPPEAPLTESPQATPVNRRQRRKA